MGACRLLSEPVKSTTEYRCSDCVYKTELLRRYKSSDLGKGGWDFWVDHDSLFEPGANYSEFSTSVFVSIVIPTHHDELGFVMRTIDSIVFTVPPSLLREIILVDDANTEPEWQKGLASLKHYHPVVRLVSSPVRLGLVQAKNFGASIATSPYLIFLEAHVEVLGRWFSELLRPVLQDASGRTVVVPHLQGISEAPPHNFFNQKLLNGSFVFHGLTFVRKEIDTEITGQPFHTAVMSGGLFAVSAAWWRRLEGHDPGLGVFGCENIEMSIMLWSCGGRLLYAPKSVVAHTYKIRASLPYSRGTFLTNLTKCRNSLLGAQSKGVDCGNGTRQRACYDCAGGPDGCAGDCAWQDDGGVCLERDAHHCTEGDADWANSVRVGSVWMGEIFETHYKKIFPFVRTIFTDEFTLRRRKELRRELQCKPFEWYLTYVSGIPDPRNQTAYDKYLDSLRSSNMVVAGYCSDVRQGGRKCNR